MHPITDAGILIDFPVRLITNIRMVISEIMVWVIAIALNLYSFFIMPQIYEKTRLLTLFKYILSKPVPFWLVIIISAIGTFASIQFGDEVFDNVTHKDKREFYEKHKHKHRFIKIIFICACAFVLYNFLLKQLDIDLP